MRACVRACGGGGEGRDAGTGRRGWRGCGGGGSGCGQRPGKWAPGERSEGEGARRGLFSGILRTGGKPTRTHAPHRLPSARPRREHAHALARSLTHTALATEARARPRARPPSRLGHAAARGRCTATRDRTQDAALNGPNGRGARALNGRLGARWRSLAAIGDDPWLMRTMRRSREAPPDATQRASYAPMRYRGDSGDCRGLDCAARPSRVADGVVLAMRQHVRAMGAESRAISSLRRRAARLGLRTRATPSPNRALRPRARTRCGLGRAAASQRGSQAAAKRGRVIRLRARRAHAPAASASPRTFPTGDPHTLPVRRETAHHSNPRNPRPPIAALQSRIAPKHVAASR
jgi:hypothetical protein